MKRVNISLGWKLLGAFGASLLIVISIGLIGIFQIHFLSAKVDILGRHYLAMQAAVQELKANNNLYVMEVKNYALWKGSRYLEAARAAPDLKIANAAAARFTRQINVYSEHLQFIEEKSLIDKTWVAAQRQRLKELSSYKKELKALGSRIIELAEQGANPAAINMSIMDFDSSRHRIEEFISQTIEKDIKAEVQKQLFVATQAKDQAVTLLWWSLGLGVLIASQTAWLVFRNLKQGFKRRQSIVREMIRTEERERRHLSAQVHDQLSQDLGALKIYLGLIQKQAVASSSELEKQLSQSKKIVTDLLDKSHNISLLLRPPSLDEVGLAGSLEALIADSRRLSKAEFEFEKPESEVKLSPEHSLYLYRFLQEVLTNAAKYAGAKKIRVSLKSHKKEVRLYYQDDGKGFDYEKLLRTPCRRREDKVKLGLLSLQERAELLGGLMRIDTAPGRGTRITVRLSV